MIKFIRKSLSRLIPEEKKWEWKARYSIPSMKWSLLNMKRNGFGPVSIVDVGAYKGS